MKNNIENITKLNNCIGDAETKRLMNFQRRKGDIKERMFLNMLQKRGKIYKQIYKMNAANHG